MKNLTGKLLRPIYPEVDIWYDLSNGDGYATGTIDQSMIVVCTKHYIPGSTYSSYAKVAILLPDGKIGVCTDNMFEVVQ